ncbi:MAG TPA: 1-acyl-sn-glycerol-3-phosphate acyltransferase [Candidatus Rifleibacterium sp.]|nr:1-acyl-sn-glycerol-3-phosphate acyltransferase [Candidatus Rifleibacterium sp.]HPT47826.1 1-acyl-sn-glycerol-3-phosphate acyltransferase [Candidatus Rifleibacterium sp.]
MSQMTHNADKPAPVAIVGKSALFPVAMAARAFWPNLLGLKGLLAGLATSQWPFSEFFSENDLKNLKGFVMQSGLLSSGSLPAGGFEIPPEVLKISAVMPVLGLFLAQQALEDTLSFKKGCIKADQVRVVLERRQPQITDSQALSATSQIDVAELFARHFGFSVSPVTGSAPLPGTISWLGAAVRELQAGSADLIIAGSVDSVHTVYSWAEMPGAEGNASSQLREGLSMFALRRLSDAERDGDQILAVISGVDAAVINFATQPPGQAAATLADRSASSALASASANAASSAATAPAHKIQGSSRAEQYARFARLPVSDIVLAADGSCLNLPFNHLPEDGSDDATLDWKKVRERWVKHDGSRRFFHDLLGALFGTFVSRVVVQNPAAFAEVAARPVVFLANHQVGLESPLFMAMAHVMTGMQVQAVAKPDHVNAWLAFLLAFACDSLGENHPFRLMYFDRQNPQQLIDTLKKAGKQEASLLVHVEGTRSSAANQPVTRLSSIFLDMAIDKNLPLVPLRFVGGLPVTPTDERFDFPYGNGKQDYLIGAPIMPEQLKKMPYGQRPRFLMDLINNLGPGKDEDHPLTPDKTFEAKTRFFIDTFGFPKMQAMLFAILQKIDDPCEETAQLAKAVQSGKVDPKNPDIPPVLKNFLGHIKTKFS